jgi:hypothetical protein
MITYFFIAPNAIEGKKHSLLQSCLRSAWNAKQVGFCYVSVSLHNDR